MYWKPFGLREDPFALSPDSRFLFLNEANEEVLATLVETIEGQRGLVALTSNPGLGKTTLLFQFMEQIKTSAVVAFVFQTTFEPLDILRLLWRELGIDNTQADLVKMHEQFEQALSRVATMGKQFVLVVDEAQNLTPQALETIRLLANFETARKKMVQIVLAGHPELETLLGRPGLEHVKQRIAAFCRLKPFTAEETTKYVLHRLEAAGNDGKQIFTDDALLALSELSKGIPRTVNIYAFQAMMKASKKKTATIDEFLLRQAVHQFEGWPEPQPVSDAPATPISVPKRELTENPDQELKTLLDSMRETLTAAGFSPDGEGVEAPPREATVTSVTPMPERTLPQSLTASTAPALQPVAAKQPSEKLTVMPAKSGAAAAPAATAPAKATPQKPSSRNTLVAVLAVAVLSASGAGGWYAWKMRVPKFTPPQPTPAAAVIAPAPTNATAATDSAEEVPSHTVAPQSAVSVTTPPAQPATQQPAKPKPAQPEAREISSGKATRAVADAGAAPAVTLALNSASSSNLGNALASPTANVALKSQGITQGPSTRVNPRPAYPLEARKRGIAGTVVLKVQVNAYGEPTRVQIVSGHPSLAVPAQNLVKSSWQFYPATVDGKPVAGETEVRLNFHP